MKQSLPIGYIFDFNAVEIPETESVGSVFGLDDPVISSLLANLYGKDVIAKISAHPDTLFAYKLTDSDVHVFAPYSYLLSRLGPDTLADLEDYQRAMDFIPDLPINAYIAPMRKLTRNHYSLLSASNLLVSLFYSNFPNPEKAKDIATLSLDYLSKRNKFLKKFLQNA